MQEKKMSPVAEYFIKTILDPVLWYTTLIMTAIMYHYYDKGVTGFFLASLVMIYLLFRLFDFMNRKKLLGGVLYLAVGYVVFFVLVRYCMDKGMLYYEEELNTRPMNYGLWFITPQLALDYNIWYSYATFFMFAFFMASVVYYFSRVRYRVFMSFLIFIIPFMLYGKEYEVMPIFFIILLSTGYIALMFYCRQLKEGGSTVIVSKRDILSSAGVFTLIFAIIASVVPKPDIQEDREAIETLISAERFTDRLVETLSSLRGTSSGGQFRGTNSQVPLFYAKSDSIIEESVKLKTRTFTDYSFQYDSWNATARDTDTSETGYEMPLELSVNGELTDALLLAVSADSDFAEKYGLSEFAGTRTKKPSLRKLKLYSVFDNGNSVPVPQYAQAMTDTSYGWVFKLGRTGTVFTPNNYGADETFSFTYAIDSFLSFPGNKEFVDRISGLDYQSFMTDASDVLFKRSLEAEYDEDDEMAEKYYDACCVVDESLSEYTGARRLLEYDDKTRIKELSDEITAGLDNDYDKAVALEWYFYNNGYHYDLSYVKTQGENVENFIFNSKTGVCYEYATAMVMLARAAGIPARYCEGFGLHTYQENSKLGTNYVITAMDAHGYPELYIRGYGWMPFEPTRSDGNDGQREAGAAASRLSTAGMLLLVGAVIALLLYIASPFLLHKLFLMIYRRKAPSVAAIAAMRRICRIYELGRTKTSGEVTEAVAEISGADISGLALLFDRAAYGGEKLSEAEREKALELYTGAYTALRQSKKRQRRLTLTRS